MDVTHPVGHRIVRCLGRRQHLGGEERFTLLEYDIREGSADVDRDAGRINVVGHLGALEVGRGMRAFASSSQLKGRRKSTANP